MYSVYSLTRAWSRACCWEFDVQAMEEDFAWSSRDCTGMVLASSSEVIYCSVQYVARLGAALGVQKCCPVCPSAN